MNFVYLLHSNINHLPVGEVSSIDDVIGYQLTAYVRQESSLLNVDGGVEYDKLELT